MKEKEISLQLFCENESTNDKNFLTEASKMHRKYYMSEFSLYDGDHNITFNIVEIDTVKNEIIVAVSNEGRISVCTFDLKLDGKRLYFEYGVMCEKIAVDDFEHIEEELR